MAQDCEIFANSGANGLVFGCLDKNAEILIHQAFKELCESDNPNVIIFASCYSFYSEIKQLMRSAGLLSVVAMQEDRGEISFGKIFKLGQEQKQVLDEVAGNKKIKDIVLKGKDFLIDYCSLLKLKEILRNFSLKSAVILLGEQVFILSENCKFAQFCQKVKYVTLIFSQLEISHVI